MSTLFIATGDSFARVTQQGEEWDVKISLDGSGAQCLALDQHHHGTNYTGSHSEGVWKSENDGGRWSNLATAMEHSHIFSLAVSPVDGSIYAGCEPSMILKSMDEGRNWDELEELRKLPSAPTWSFPPRPWTSHVRWIAPNPHDADLLLAGIELGGVMRSDDGGETWLDHRPGAQRDVHALAWHPQEEGRAYEAAGGGAAWSKDNGDTWQSADAGRDHHYTWGLAVDPLDADCWYISASPGPRQAHSGNNAGAHIYRWRGGGPWQVLGGGLPQPLNSLPYALAIAPGQLYAGLSNGQIYASYDGGDSWSLLTLRGDLLPSVRAMVCLS
jgi:photosystem II stability/assembly factor-like uncharacterized protein